MSLPERVTDQVRVRRLSTIALSTADVSATRAIMVAAFGDDEDEAFRDEDWDHALGGTHVLADVHGEIVAHASVVERELHVGGQPVRTGYVEAVATAPAWQGRGIGTRVMEVVGDVIRDGFALGALGTGSFRVLPASRLADLARPDIRAGANSHPPHAGRGWLHHGPDDTRDPRARSRCAHQLRVAPWRRLVMRRVRAVVRPWL